MSWFTNLRILAFCRRAVRAIESIAESQKTLAHLAESDWAARSAPKARNPADFSAFDPQVASKRWREEQSLKGR